MAWSDTPNGSWQLIKGMVKENWGRLTDDDMRIVSGRRDQLIGRLQERYGLSREEAERQLQDFDSRFGSSQPWSSTTLDAGSSGVAEGSTTMNHLDTAVKAAGNTTADSRRGNQDLATTDGRTSHRDSLTSNTTPDRPFTREGYEGKGNYREKLTDQPAVASATGKAPSTLGVTGYGDGTDIPLHNKI